MDLLPPTQHIAPGLTQSGALNALQLAAKMVELVIMASMSFIVMHSAQRYLLGKSGLPLGLMASPHQIMTGELLRRKGFWSAWNARSTFNGASAYTPFWILCLAATLLIIITGPSAAIAVIPTLNWFSVNKPFTNGVSPFYVFNATTELWPAIVDQKSLNGKASGNPCLSSYNKEKGDCPSGGFMEVYNWAENLAFDNLAAGSNMSTPNDRGDTRRIMSVQTCNGPSDGRATALSITSALSNALVGYWGFARNNFNGTVLKSAHPKIVPDSTQALYSPRVDVICSTYRYDIDTISQQTEMVFPSFEPSQKPTPVPSSYLNINEPMNTTDFVFIGSASNSEGISIHGLATVPLVAHASAQNLTRYQESVKIPCSIYAQWAPVNVWYEPTTQDQVSIQTVDNDDRCLQASTSTRHRTQREALNMTITSRYAESVDQEIAFTTFNQSAMAGILRQFLYISNYNSATGEELLGFRAAQPTSGNVTSVSNPVQNAMLANTISAVVAGVVTDALSRVAGAGHWPYSAPFFIQPHAQNESIVGLNPISTASGGQTVPLNITDQDLGNYVRLSPSIERFGYGYKFHGNATTQFGVIVLLVHLLLAVFHTVFVMYKVLVRKEGIGNSFDTIGEIVALALNSDRSERIQNTCGGITEAETWREVVAVREIDEGHLEMVVGEEKKEMGMRPRVGTEYGTVRVRRPERKNSV